MEAKLTASNARSLTPMGSAALDAVRFAAALVVCYGHLSVPQFSTGWTPRLDWAGEAVAVFFVLSGFMMRLITTTKVLRPRDYWVDRTSRMYSVVLPAIAFTVIVTIVELLRHGYGLFTASFGTPLKLIGAILADLTFTSQILNLDITNPVNPVFWSLSYECSYYLLFGLMIFGRGRKNWLVIAALCLVLGLPIVLLFPVWLSGCVAHDIYQRLRQYRLSWWVSSLGLLFMGAAILASRDLFRSALSYVAGGGPSIGLGGLHALLKTHHVHLFQRASPQFYEVGIPAAILLIWLLLVADELQRVTLWRGNRLIRTIAEGTFCIYLMHFALLLLFVDLLGGPLHSGISKGSVFLLTVSICICLSVPMERFKRRLRARLQGIRRQSLDNLETSPSHF
jgi:peptidoglycan/LPS O-acetylase OafA/YrhL